MNAPNHIERQQQLEIGEQLSRDLQESMGKTLNLTKLKSLIQTGTEEDINKELARLRFEKDEKIRRWDDDASATGNNILRFIFFWLRS